MIRKLAVLVLAVAAVAPAAFAGVDGEGFKTGSCAYPAGVPMPGDGATIPAGPAPSYPYVDGQGNALTTPLQAAIDGAEEGDTILLQAGIYEESVEVTTPGLRLRGVDRDEVVFDGGSALDVAITVDGADRVVIENMTAHNYTRHGFYWYEVKGYWGRYLTAYNFGLYGLYAFDSRCGEISDSYASGGADSGFYIGECFPCDAVIHDIVAERNALGYSGTNAGGDLVLRDSTWRNNAMGIVPNSLDGEDRPPQRGIIIKNNLIDNNNAIDAPGTGIAGTYYGVGIAIAGGNGNQVYGNVITDHALAGVVLSPLPDQNLWVPSGNTVWGNTVTHDAALYPDSFDLGQALLSGPGNCWADNTFGTSAPVMIEDLYGCGVTLTLPGGDPRAELGLIQGAAGLNGRINSPWQTWPAPTAPEATTEMPDTLTGPITEWLPALF